MNPAQAATAHQAAWVAAGLRRAARRFGVDLPATYSENVSAAGLDLCPQLGVTAHGIGVAIHTVPEDNRSLPVLLGYADQTGQWYRDGSRHPTYQTAPADPVSRSTGISL